MKRLGLLAAVSLMSVNFGQAQTIVPVSTIQPGEVLSVVDLRVAEGDVKGAIRDAESAVGLEARTVLYAGRPIRSRDLGPPAVIERNQIVSLIFSVGGMSIMTAGRALDRAASGDSIRVMNLASRTTVSGRASPSGAVRVNH